MTLPRNSLMLSQIENEIACQIETATTEKEKFGEVMTKLSMVEEMLNTIDDSFWKNPSLRILDPCAGIGNFPIIIIKKLMIGLSDLFPNESDRLRHIMNNMIFTCEIQEKNVIKYKELFGDSVNIFQGDFLSSEFDNNMDSAWGIDKFDLIVMNSPYQTPSDGEHNRSRPLYHLFINKAINLSDKILSIHPSRWMGKSIGLDSFRSNMLKRKDIVLIRNFSDAKSVFNKTVEIRGGVQYLLLDKSHNSEADFDGVKCYLDKYDIFVDPVFHSILDKTLNCNLKNLSNICQSNSLFMNFNNSALSATISEDTLPCYVSKQKGDMMYINKDRIMNKGRKYINSWKVFTPFASGQREKFNFFGQKIIGKPGEVCSNSFLTLIVESQEQANSLTSYMNTKFCNFMLSLRKNTQNMNKNTLSWIPLVPLDRQWTDSDLFSIFNLSDNEIGIINRARAKMPQ